MICKREIIKGREVGCDGAGTVWINNILVDCRRCGGFGEILKMKHIPTYLKPREL